MQVYKYDEQTKEYLGAEIAMLNPLESQQQGKEIYLLPANATFTAPTEKEGFANVWDGEQWQHVEDNRGAEYWLPGDTYGTPAHVMNDLGALPEGATFTAPEKSFEQLKKEKLQKVDAWTAAKITGGFTSSASGEPVRYDSDKDTQLTMQGIALNVHTAQFAEKYPGGCPVRGYADGASVKAVYMLTAEQVLAWCADLSIHIGTCKQEGWAKQAAVQAATSAEELDAIIL
jgi:hypothetical protein